MTMPETKDREPHFVEGYLESDADWGRDNWLAVRWLADNHAAIRTALDYAKEKLEQDVDALLDDPHGVWGEGKDKMTAADIMAHLQQLHDVAKLVGHRGISDIIAQMSNGKGYEFTRLMDIIAKARLEIGAGIHD